MSTGKVIKAWDMGVATMKKDEVAELYCTSEYAYGKSGSGPKIPPNATLVFQVELLSWEVSGSSLPVSDDKTIMLAYIAPCLA